MSLTTMQHRRPSRRTLRVTAVVVGALVLLPLGGAWLVFQHKPGWYRPAALDGAGIQAARRDVTNLTDSIGDQLVGGQPFDLVLSQPDINAWLTALPQLWPDAAENMGETVSHPAVSFEPDTLRVGAELASGGWRVIANAALALDVSADGRTIRIVPSQLRGGSLPIPTRLLESAFQQVMANVRGPSRQTRSPLADVRTMADLLQGVSVENRFVWPNGKRAFRVARISIADGELRLRIEPL